MDRKKMETLVLIVGTLVVAAALIMYFVMGDNPSKPLYTNIVFAVGFLCYIAYNTITTSGLQKEIKDLNGHINGLKTELEERRADIAKLEQDLRNKNEELKAKADEAAKLESDLQKLQKDFDALNSQKEAES